MAYLDRRLLELGPDSQVEPTGVSKKFQPAMQVGDYMATQVDTVSPDANLFDVATRFAEVSYKRFPVVDNGKLVGQISRTDVLRAIEDLGLS